MAGSGDATPTGAAPLPPDWLAGRRLPMVSLAERQSLHRIHRVDFDPVFFGPGPGRAPVSRFDSAAGLFGVLYLGETFEAAFVETMMRNPHRRMVRFADLAARSHCGVTANRALRLVKMYDEGLASLGTDNAISTGPYGPCGLWADALWNHRDRPDGIAYRSRHDPALLCFAVFERTDIGFTAGPSEALDRHPHAVAALLDRYGKSLDASSAR